MFYPVVIKSHHGEEKCFLLKGGDYYVGFLFANRFIQC